MPSLDTIFILLFAAVLLVGMAQKIHLPYPIALILGGTAIGFIPRLHFMYFDPEIVLFIVLPPILYYAAFGLSFREFQKNWKEIFSLALGLVVFTTAVIAIIFKWFFPEYSWALAFTFGAIVSPPDATSVTVIMRRFKINSRLVSILEGESLVNDASAIVLYKLARAALLSGSFSLWEGGHEFFQMVFGGIALGFVLGFLLQTFSKRYLEPTLGVVFSFTIPYLTFILANWIDFSGVLAVVVNGLIGSRILLHHPSSLRRVLGYAAWDIFIILLNCFVFILIGLQLHWIASKMSLNQMLLYSGYACLIAFAMAAIRMMWVGIAYVKASSREGWKEALLVGWCGMRGIVSLALAAALPFALEGRNEVIFVTFVVIVLTLLIPGLTLPSLIRLLKMEVRPKHHNEHRVREELIKVAENTLRHFCESQSISQKEFDFLRSYITFQHQIFELSHAEEKLQNSESIRLKILQAQRKKLIELWEKQEIDDKLLTHLEAELDSAEVHVARAEL
jgi:monovalent cation/hydrogen antiporter